MFWRTSFLTFCPNSKYISPVIHGTTRLHAFHVIIEKTPNISTHAQSKNTTITWTKHGPERSPSQKWTAPRSPRPGEFTWLPRKHTPDSLDSLPLILSSLSLPLSLSTSLQRTSPWRSSPLTPTPKCYHLIASRPPQTLILDEPKTPFPLPLFLFSLSLRFFVSFFSSSSLYLSSASHGIGSPYFDSVPFFACCG